MDARTLRLLALFGLLGGACRAQLPDGVFACLESRDCPSSQRCHAGLCVVDPPSEMMTPATVEDAAAHPPAEPTTETMTSEAGASGGTPPVQVMDTAGAAAEATPSTPSPCVCTKSDGCCDGCKPRNEDVACESDSLACTRDVCRNGACVHLHDASSKSCLIAGECFAEAAQNPKNQCEHCDVARSIERWSARMPGATCDDGRYCNGIDRCGAGANLGRCIDHDGDPCVVLQTCSACNEAKKSCTFQSNSTWLDASTNLTWTVAQVAQNRNFQGALDACASLRLCPDVKWRLPTIDELRTIVRNCPNVERGGACRVMNGCGDRSACVMNCSACSSDSSSGDPKFRIEQLVGYAWEWSSSVVLNDPDSVWMLAFNTGDIGSISRDSTSPAVRCVKTGH